jgi:hypothetical protein
MFIRSKPVAGRTYYQVVESYRDQTGTPRHRTVASLGRHPSPADALAAARKALAGARRELARWEELAAAHPAFAGRRTEAEATLRRRIARLEAQIATLVPIKGLKPYRGKGAEDAPRVLRRREAALVASRSVG